MWTFPGKKCWKKIIHPQNSEIITNCLIFRLLTFFCKYHIFSSDWLSNFSWKKKTTCIFLVEKKENKIHSNRVSGWGTYFSGEKKIRYLCTRRKKKSIHRIILTQNFIPNHYSYSNTQLNSCYTLHPHRDRQHAQDAREKQANECRTHSQVRHERAHRKCHTENEENDNQTQAQTKIETR